MSGEKFDNVYPDEADLIERLGLQQDEHLGSSFRAETVVNVQCTDGHHIEVQVAHYDPDLCEPSEEHVQLKMVVHGEDAKAVLAFMRTLPDRYSEELP